MTVEPFTENPAWPFCWRLPDAVVWDASDKLAASADQIFIRIAATLLDMNGGSMAAAGSIGAGLAAAWTRFVVGLALPERTDEELLAMQRDIAATFLADIRQIERTKRWAVDGGIN